MNRDEVMEHVRGKVHEARREQGGEALGVEELTRLLKHVEHVELRHKVAQQELTALNAWVNRAGRDANEEILEKSEARRVKEPAPSIWDAAIAAANAAKAARVRQEAHGGQEHKTPTPFEVATIEEATSSMESLVKGALKDKVEAMLLLKGQPNGEQKVKKFWDVFYKVFVHGMPEDAAVAVSLLSAWPRARQDVMKFSGSKVRFAAVHNFVAAQEFLRAQPEGERLAQEHKRLFGGIKQNAKLLEAMKQKFGEKAMVSANASALLHCGLEADTVRLLNAEVARLKIPVIKLERRKPQGGAGGGGAGGKPMKRPGEEHHKPLLSLHRFWPR